VSKPRRASERARVLRDDELEQVVGGQVISADVLGESGLRAREAFALRGRYKGGGGGFSGGGATGTW
jgi:uncharacterized membrane protein YgcG